MESIGLRAVLEINNFIDGVMRYVSGVSKMESGTDDVTTSLNDMNRAELQMSQSLQSMSSMAGIGEYAINQLDKALKDGTISEDVYTKALQEVQRQFGLTTPSSDALAQKIISLNQALAKGEITADQYAKEIQDAAVQSKALAQETTKAQTSFGDMARTIGGDIMRGAIERIGQIFTNLAAQIPQVAMEIVSLGAQVEASKKRLDSFAGGAEIASTYLDAISSASDGAIDRLSAMRAAAKLLQMGLAKTSDEMELIAEIALKLGDQTTSTGDRINDFALMLANQSVQRLDNFGISSGRVRARIEELQKSIIGLSREEAFKIATMEEGRVALEKLGNTSELTTSKIDKLTAAITDAKIGFGEMAINASASAIDIDYLAEAIRSMPEVVQINLDYVTASFEFWAKIMKGDVIGAATDFNGKLDEMAASAAVVVNRIEGVTEEEIKLARSTRDSSISFDQYNEAIKTATNSIDMANLSTYKLNQEQSLQAILAGQDSAAAWNQYQSALETSYNAMDSAAISAESLRQAQESQRIATENTTVALLDLSAKLLDATSAEIARAAITELKAAYDAGKITIDEYTAAVNQTQLEFGLATPQSIALANGVVALTTAVSDGSINADDFAARLMALTNQIELDKLQADALASAINAIPNRTVTITVQYDVQPPPDDVGSIGGGPEQAPPSSDSGYGGATPGMASGGIARGGWTMVGEQGPELVNLPRGATVSSTDETNKLLQSVSLLLSSRSPVSQMTNSSKVINAPINATINNGMDMFAFQSRVQQAMANAL